MVPHLYYYHCHNGQRKHPGRITASWASLRVNIAFSWTRSLMHTASSGKDVPAARHLGPPLLPAPLIFLRLSVHPSDRVLCCLCLLVCAHVRMRVCVCAWLASRRTPGPLSPASIPPAGHLPLAARSMGGEERCNLAANLIIQIAKYLMVLKR